VSTHTHSHSYPHSYPTAPRDPDVLGELLHSLSQPLTGLRCSLEHSLQLPLDLSIEQVAQQQQETAAVALEQTEKVIGMIQLMREYLDAARPGAETVSSALAPVLQSVIEELSSIAAVRGVRLLLVGSCTAHLPLPKARLRLALQYLIATVIDAQPAGGRVMLLLGEGPTGAVLQVEGDRGVRDRKSVTSLQTTLRGARIAIARRVLENAGASLVFADDAQLVLGIPIHAAVSAQRIKPNLESGSLSQR
jgi:signal transduction histidine kinase